MRRALCLIVIMSILFSLLPQGYIYAADHVVSIDTNLVSSGHGGQITVSADADHEFDAGTTVRLEFYYNGVLYKTDPTISTTRKQIIIYIPPTNEFKDTGGNKAPLYTGIANIIIDNIKVSADGSTTSDTLQFNFVKDPVISDVYLNVETTFIRDSLGNITGTKEVRQLIIDGENFDLKELMIGGTDGVGGLSSLKGEVKLLSKDSLRIVAEVPEQIVNDGTTVYEVSVRNNNNGLAIRKGFIFNELPHIQNIDKTRAYPGDKLTITGTNLPESVSDVASVVIAKSSIPVDENNIQINNTNSLDTMTVTVPEAGDRTNKDISIRKKIVQDGVYRNDVQVTLKNEFTVVYTPAGLTIDRIEPNSGTTDGGTEIRIYGTGFVQGMQVFIGGHDSQNRASVTSISVDPNNPGTTFITAVTPPSADEGAKDVYVYNPVDGSEVRKIGGFTYISVANALTIYPEQINPQEARETEQKQVSIVGRNISNINISSLLPADGDNWYDVEPLTEFFDPVAKEYVVHYKGKYQNNDVYIEKTVKLTIGNESNIESINFKTGSRDQIITAKTPIVTLNPRVDTKVDVAVNTHTVAGIVHDDPQIESRYTFQNVLLETSESAVVKNGFTYKPDLTEPQIAAVHPYMGSRLGGDEITIEGTDIRPGAKVYIGEETAKNLAQTVSMSIYESNGTINSTLKIKTPSSDTLGEKDIIIVNSEGGRTVKEGAFEYISNPEISSITPAVGSINDEIYVSINGSDFLVMSDENGNPIFPKVWIGNQIINVTGVYDDKGNVIDGRRFKTGTRIKGYIPAGGTKILGYADVKMVNPDYPGFGGLDDYPTVYDMDIIASGGKAILEAAFKYTNPTYKMKVDRIEPSRGPVEGGTKVTITGGTFPKSVYVTIDGEPAKVSSATGSTISIVTPPGTVGKKTLQVISLTAGDAEGAVATVKDGFEYTIMTTSPKITSIVPSHGGKGTEVWIKGSDFVMSTPLMDENNNPVKDEDGRQVYSEQSSVIVGGRRLDRVEDSVYVWDPNTISFVMPSIPDDEKPIAGSYDVYVENPDTAVSNSVKFSFQIPDSKPEIENITPVSGSTKGGTVVEITGSDFRQDLEVYFGGLKADIISFDEDNQVITVKTPPHGPGQVNVMVLNKDGGNFIKIDGFNYVSPSSSPTITSVTPNTGSAFGGDLVTINGDDFRKNGDLLPEVYFGNQKAQRVDYVKYNQLAVITPPYSVAGPVDVSVINPDTGLAVLKNGFTYIQSKPQIAQIVPSILPITGGSAEIIGSGFSMRVVDEAGNEVNPGSIVRIYDGTRTIDLTLNPGENASNPTDYNIDVISSGRILIKVPQVSSIGPKKIQVINPDGGIAESTITFIKPLTNPTIDHIYPGSGSINGGTPVTVYGSDFRPNAKVYIGGREAEIKYISENGDMIRIYTPAGDPALIGIPQDVMVYNDGDNSAVLKSAFTYLDVESNPVITSIEPSQGSTLGGEKITIKGDNFMEDVRVFFDDIEAENVSRINYTTIEVTTPPHPAGKVDVVVKNIGAYGEAVLRDGFEFIETVPASPTGFKAEAVAGDTIKLTWDQLRGADFYQIYARESGDDDYHFIATTEDNEYYVKGLDRDTQYYFKLEAINSYGISESAEDSATTFDSKASSDYEDTSDENHVSISGGTAVITLGNSERDFRFELDMDPSEPLDLKINIPEHLIKTVDRWVSINTPKTGIVFSLKGFDSNAGTSYSSSRQSGNYVVLTVKELTGSDRGNYSKFIERGERALSPIFLIDANRNIDGESSPINYFNEFYIYPVYKESDGASLYYFNEDEREWDLISSGQAQAASISTPGIYAVLGR